MRLYLKELQSNGVIEYSDSFSNRNISSTPIGNAMAHNFIKFKGLKDLIKNSYNQLTEIPDLLRLLSQNSELSAQIRGGDKVLLHKIASSSKLIFPLTGKVDWEAWKKPFLFIQLALQSELAEFEAKLTPIQRSDQQSNIDQSCRLLKCIQCVVSCIYNVFLF